jgi:hypothetical protein
MNANVPVPPSDGGLPPGLSGDQVMRGTIAKWTSSTGWKDRDGLPVPSPMLVIGYFKCLRKWKDNRPEYITEYPLPEPDDLNANIPITEWETGKDGKPRPPWKLTFIVYLVHVDTGGLYTWAGDTTGAKIAYQRLEEQIAVKRLLCGENVYPIAELGQATWKSQDFGLIPRPDFKLIDWREPRHSAKPAPAPQLLGSATPTAPAAAAPTAPAAAAPAVAPATAPAAAPASALAGHLQPAKEPITVGEFIKDKMPPWA